MSDTLVRLLGLERRLQVGKRQDDAPPMAKEELGALRRLRDEAQQGGAQLRDGGKFQVPPSLALAALRKQRYQCAQCGDKHDLTVRWRMGRRGPGDVEVLCAGCSR